jgi:DNA primase
VVHLDEGEIGMLYGNIPEELIDTILTQSDIVETVAKYVHLTKRGKNHVGLCPFHSEKTPSFTVNADIKIFKCYGCGVGGNVIKFIREIEGYSFHEAVQHFAEELNIPYQLEKTSPIQTERQREKILLFEAHELTAKFYHYLLKNTNQGKQAMDYLKSRGFNDKTIDTFQIGYAPPMWDTLTQFLQKREFAPELLEKGGLISAKADGKGFVDRFRDRIMFPIRDSKGKVIAFAGRILGEGQPKYLNSPETILFHKSRILYNLDQARPAIRKHHTAILFEGYVDVIKAWEAGAANAVATMGTALSEEHAVLLKRMADQVVICYDGDEAGQAAANKHLPMLEQAGCSVTVAVIPGKQDPDEYISANGAERFVRDIIGSALPATKFKLHYLSTRFKLHEDSGKLRYIHAALRIIAELASPAEREFYLKELSTDYDFSLDTLKQTLHQIRKDLQKMKHDGDNNEKPWNNVMNDRYVNTGQALRPAYHNAERKLLAAMLHDKDITLYVQERLGEHFNVETHGALAAYIYSYFASHSVLDVSKFISILDNPELESIVSSLSMTDAGRQGVNSQVIDDYIKEIKKYPRQKEIERKKEEIVRAERTGDVLRAAQIANEIITLEKQLKSL